MSDIGTTDSSIRYDSSAADVNGDNERHSLQTYVSDMLALEQHIAQPVAGQTKSDALARYPQAQAIANQIKAQNDAHIETLRQCLKDLGGHEASGIKSAWSTLLGGAASAIGASRKTKVSKALRDDFTALSLASISYTLLYATAVGLGNTMVAGVAKQGLTDYSRSVMLINQLIPDVVLQELRDDGENVATDATDTIRREMNTIWKDQAAVLR